MYIKVQNVQCGQERAERTMGGKRQRKIDRLGEGYKATEAKDKKIHRVYLVICIYSANKISKHQ